MFALEQKTFLWQKKFLIILLVVAGLLVYAGTFGNAMFWDDNDFILDNIYIKDFQHFPKLFSENVIAGAGFESNYWRPLLLTVFSIEWHLWGSWSPGYHIVNTLIHIVAGIILFFIIEKIFRNRFSAFLVAMIFLIHPVQTEAVSYANSLGDSLSTLFMFAGVYLSLRHKLLWPLLFYILALLSKETAIIMPGLIFIAHFFREALVEEDDEEKPKEGKTLLFLLKYSLAKMWPYLLVLGLYIALRATLLDFGGTFNFYEEGNAFSENISLRILTFFKILLIYFSLLFHPITLHMERSVAVAESINEPMVLGGLALFILLIAIAVFAYKKHKTITFGILWFFIAISITSNIFVPINGLLYEHWLYVPMIGIFLAFLYIFFLASRRLNLEKIAFVFLGLVFLLLAARSIDRNFDWRDAVVFYTETLKHTPESYRVTNNLGMEYADRGMWREAEEKYKKAISINPDVAVAYHNLGNLYKDTLRRELAEENYKKALSLQSDFYFSEDALVNLYLEEERFSDARLFLEDRLAKARSEMERSRIYYLLSIVGEVKGN